MAHLKAQETRQKHLDRFEWKLALTRRLYEKGYAREDVINLFGFIDWVMSLPEELEQEFWREVRNARGGKADAIYHECRENRH